MDINSAYISIDDAATYFNVNRMTVRNWCDKGILSTITVSNRTMINTQSIRMLESQMPTITAIQRSIDDYRKELHEQKLILQGELNILQDEIRQRHWANNHIQYISEMISILLETLTDKENENNYRLVKYFLDGDDYKDIALLTGIPVKQVMYIIRSFGRTLLRTRQYTRMLQMLKQGEAECNTIKKKCLNLELEVKNLRLGYEKMIGAVMQGQENGDANLPSKHLNSEILDSYLPSDVFSTRVRNILGYYGISTIGQLVSHSKNDLATLRNMGRKSMTELTEFIHKLGLDWYGESKPASGG